MMVGRLLIRRVWSFEVWLFVRKEVWSSADRLVPGKLRASAVTAN